MKTLIIIFAFTPFITLRIFLRIDEICRNIGRLESYAYGLSGTDDE